MLEKNVNMEKVINIFVLAIIIPYLQAASTDAPETRLDTCPIVTKNVDGILQISAQCEEGAFFAQFISDNEIDKSSARRSFPSSVGINLKRLTHGILDEENLNFKQINVGEHMFKLFGTVLNTIHFADGNVPISDVKIKNLEFEQGERDFCRINLQMNGHIEINGEGYEIQLDKKSGKCVFSVRITDIQSISVEEFGGTFKASIHNVDILQQKIKFKVDALKSVVLMKPTVVGVMGADGAMQLVASGDVQDKKMAFARETALIVVNKLHGENPKLAVVFNMAKGTSMDDVFSSMIEKPTMTASLPIVGELATYEWALSIAAEGDQIAIVTPEPMLLPGGVTARMEILKSDYARICGDTSNGVPEAVSMEISVTRAGRFMFKMSDGMQANIDGLIECICPNASVILPQEVINKNTQVNVTRFYVAPKTKAFDLQLVATRNESLFFGLLNSTSFNVRVQHERNKWAVVATSTQHNAQQLATSMQRDPQQLSTPTQRDPQQISITRRYDEKTTHIKAVLGEMTSGNLLRFLGAEGNALQTPKNLSNFQLSEITVHQLPTELGLRATAFLFGLDFVFEGIAWPKFDPLSKISKSNKTSSKIKVKAKNGAINKQKGHHERLIRRIKAKKVESRLIKSKPKLLNTPVQGSQHQFILANQVKPLKGNTNILAEKKSKKEPGKNKLHNENLVGAPQQQFTSERVRTSENAPATSPLHARSNNAYNLFRAAFLDPLEPTKSSMTITTTKALAVVEPVNKVQMITKTFQKVADNDNGGGEEGDNEFANEIEQLAKEESNAPALRLDDSSRSLEASLNELAASMKRDQQPPIVRKKTTPLGDRIPRSRYTIQHNSTTQFDTIQHSKRTLAPHPLSGELNLHSSNNLSEHKNKRQRVVRSVEERATSLNVVFNLHTKDVLLVDLLENVYGKPMHFVPNWLSGVDAVVTLSTYTGPAPIPKETRKRDVLDSQSQEKSASSANYVKGISGQFIVEELKECRNSELCQWLKRNVIGAINLKGSLSRDNVHLASDLNLQQDTLTTTSLNVVLLSASLTLTCDQVAAPEDCGVGVTTLVSVKSPIAFTAEGRISGSASGSLVLQTNPSAVKPIRFATFFIIEPRKFSTFLYIDTPAKIEIPIALKLSGAKEDGTVVLFNNALLAFEPTNPNNFNLTAEGNGDFGIQQLVSALNMEVILPNYLRNTAFPNSVQLQITGSETTQEIVIVGDIRVFEFFVSCRVLIQQSRVLSIRITLNPIDIHNGLVKLRRSQQRSQHNSGPAMSVEISNGQVNGEMYGMVETLGNRVLTRVTLQNNTVQFNWTSGSRLVNSITSPLNFKGKLNAQFLKTDFQVTGEINSVELSEVGRKVMAKIDSSVKEMDELVKKLTSIYKTVQFGVHSSRERSDKWKGRLNAYENQLKLKVEELKSKRDEMKTVCQDKCPETCIPFFGWNNECYKIWGAWVGCPGWDNCRWKRKDALCIAECELERTRDKIIVWGDSVGVQAYIGLTDIAGEVHAQIDSLLNGFRRLDGLSRQVVEQLEQNNNNFKPNITLRRITFTCYLNKFWKSVAFFNITADVQGTWEESATLGTEVHERLAEKIFEKRFPELANRKTFHFHAVAEQLTKQYDVLTRQEESLEKRIDEIAAGKTVFNKNIEDKGTRRGTVGSEEDLKSLLDEPYTLADGGCSLHTYQESTPWSLLQDFDYEMNNTPLVMAGTKTNNAQSRSMDSCQQMRRVVEKYDKLTLGMKQFAESAQYQRHMFEENKQGYLATVGQMKKQVNRLESSRNLSVADVEDLSFWYNNVRYGVEEWSGKVEEIYVSGQKRGLTAFKNQMDFVLKQQKNSNNVIDYVTQLHQDGMKAYKRTTPNFNTIKGGIYLSEVKKSILELYNDVDTSLGELSDKISNTEKKIKRLKIFMLNCK